MKSKLCPKCNTIQPIGNFSKDHTTKTSYRSHCKKCCGIYRKVYYERNRKKLIANVVNWKKDHHSEYLKYMKHYRQKIKIQLMTAYGGKCTCCGESHVEFLTIEHKNRDGQAHKRRLKTSLAIYKEIIKQGFPDQYTVLCMNCNFARRFNKVCPHKIERQALINATK